MTFADRGDGKEQYFDYQRKGEYFVEGAVTGKKISGAGEYNKRYVEDYTVFLSCRGGDNHIPPSALLGSVDTPPPLDPPMQRKLMLRKSGKYHILSVPTHISLIYIDISTYLRF